MGTYMQIWIWLFDSARHDLFAAMHCTISVVTGVRAVSPPYEICHLLGVVYFQYGIYYFLTCINMSFSIRFLSQWHGSIKWGPFFGDQTCWWFRNSRDSLTSWGNSSWNPAFSTIPGGWPWDFWTINHQPRWQSHDVVVDARLYGRQLWPSSAPPSLRIHYGASSTKSLWPWQTSAKTSGLNWPWSHIIFI